MVDKPGRRRKSTTNWVKWTAVFVAAIVIGATGWYVYSTYLVAKPAPEYAAIDTSLGVIDVELYPACAPKTVANFVKLADSGFYDDLVWWRIDPGFVIQTGDPDTRGGANDTRQFWGKGGSNTTVPLEVTDCSWIGNYVGYLGMAREGNDTYGQDTGTSQFFINLTNSSYVDLDGYYTAFGKVISGMTVVCDIASVPIYTSTSSAYYDQPKAAVFMYNVTMISAAQAPTPVPIKGCKS